VPAGPVEIGECEPGYSCTLSDGEHVTDALAGTELAFNLGEEWTAYVSPRGPLVTMHLHAPLPAWISAFVTTGEVFTDPCALEPTAEIGATADDVMQWLAGHPDLAEIPFAADTDAEAIAAALERTDVVLHTSAAAQVVRALAGPQHTLIELEHVPQE
jgi:hypothetical protein